jgi:hypothetical protein
MRAERQPQPQLPNKQASSPHRLIIVMFWCIGILMGLFVREFVETAGETVGQAPPVSAASKLADQGEAGPVSTLVVNVHAVLDLPTAPPTETPTPRPTATAERTPALDFCGALPAEEGSVCRMPMPTATATPTLPACFSPEAEPGTLCQYRLTPTPEPGGQWGGETMWR